MLTSYVTLVRSRGSPCYTIVTRLEAYSEFASFCMSICHGVGDGWHTVSASISSPLLSLVDGGMPDLFHRFYRPPPIEQFCVVYWRAKMKDGDAEEAEPSVEDAVYKRCVGGSLEKFQSTKEWPILQAPEAKGN